MSELELVNLIFTICTSLFPNKDLRIECMEKLVNCGVKYTGILNEKDFKEKCIRNKEWLKL